jgi:transposase
VRRAERPEVSQGSAVFRGHNITWRALPEKFWHWNSVWKRFWRLSRSGTFEAFFDALAAMSETAHLVQMFDSTVMRAHVSAAGGLPTAFHLTGGEASDSRNF